LLDLISRCHKGKKERVRYGRRKKGNSLYFAFRGGKGKATKLLGRKNKKKEERRAIRSKRRGKKKKRRNIAAFWKKGEGGGGRNST